MDGAKKEVTLAERWSPEALKAIGRLDFIAKEALDGVRIGLHRSPRRGFSSEFFDYKPYDQGDDAARIDWRLYAKTGKFFIKRFEAETSLECLMLMDFSKSMSWCWLETVSKLEYSTMLAATLGMLLNLQRDLVGMHSFGASPDRHLKPRASSSQLQELFSALGDVRSEGDGSSLLTLSRSVSSIRRHKGLLMLFSDLEVPRDELGESLSLMRSRGDELIVMHILDKAEIELPFTDATHIEDSETGETIPFDAPALRASQRRRVEEFRSFARGTSASVGATYVPLDTSIHFVKAVMEIERLREETL